MRFPYIILCLIILLPSCTQTKAKKGNHSVQSTYEVITIETIVENTPSVDNSILIGGYNTGYTSSRAFTETFLNIRIRITTYVDLSGIEQFANLESLWLHLWETSDIDFSPLKSLSKLRYIDIRGSALSEIPDLDGIPSLVRLGLDNNSLTSLNGLEKIPQLEHLDIHDALEPITDTSALQHLKKLKSIGIARGSYSVDFSNLKDLPELKDITINGYGEFDFIGIGQLSQLEKLHLGIGLFRETGREGVFRNIEEIGRITGLKELYLDEVIASVEFLANNVSLERLELIAGRGRLDYYTGVTLPLDVAPLGNLKKLKYLAIRGFDLKNAHVLETLPELETLDTDLYRRK